MISFETDKKGLALEAEVDQLLGEFERWFVARVENVGLTGPERAIIKTFLYFQLVAKKQSPEGNVSVGGVP